MEERKTNYSFEMMKERDEMSKIWEEGKTNYSFEMTKDTMKERDEMSKIWKEGKTNCLFRSSNFDLPSHRCKKRGNLISVLSYFFCFLRNIFFNLSA